MEINTILDTLGIPVSTTIVILILSFIKIPKVEVNLWGIIGKALSKGINGPVLDKIDEVEKKLDEHITESELESARSARSRILRFNDEIIMGQEHTKEHYDDILDCIDKYDKYCSSHPDFPNSKCVLACEHIKDVYTDKMDNNGFVTVERLVNVKKDTNHDSVK